MQSLRFENVGTELKKKKSSPWSKLSTVNVANIEAETDIGKKKKSVLQVFQAMFG